MQLAAAGIEIANNSSSITSGCIDVSCSAFHASPIALVAVPATTDKGAVKIQCHSLAPWPAGHLLGSSLQQKKCSVNGSKVHRGC
jgi:hypothetical protein